jgi:hypothetical protein
MNLVNHGPLFFLIGGVILIACGLLQCRFNSREKPLFSLSRILTPGGLRILLFFAVGLFAILVGVGLIPLGPSRSLMQGH